jgi:hypothetical protein
MDKKSPQHSLYVSELLCLELFDPNEIINITSAAKEYLSDTRPKLISKLLNLVNSV